MNTTDSYFTRFTKIAKSCEGKVPVNQILKFTKDYYLTRKKNE